MKRIVLILYCTVSVCGFASAQGFGGFNGELRYQYLYQDYVSAGAHAITSTQNPMLRVNGSGSIFDPSIISFNLQTLLILTRSSARAAQNSLTSKSFSWDYYNATFTILPGFPIGSSLQLTDGITQSSSSSERMDGGENTLRRQQQNLTLTSHQVPFLPNVRFAIFRRHQWSLDAERPVDETSTNYSINLSSAGKGGSVSLTGTLSENSEHYTGSTTRYTTLSLNGTRNLSVQQSMSYNVNYNRYADATSIRGLVSYVNSSDKQWHYSTTLHSQAYSGPTFQSILTGLSQQIQYIQNDHFRYGLGLGGSYGKDEFASATSNSGTTSGGNASFSIQHSRSFDRIGISNGFSIGYGIVQYLDHQATFTTSLSNSVSIPVGTYAVSAGHSITYGNLRNNQRRNWVSNNANLDLSGTTVYNFQMQLNTTYQSEVNSGELPLGYGNTRDFRLQWMINSPPFTVDRLQFSIGVNGVEDWIMANSTDRISFWSASFALSQSYIRNLSLAYHFNRSVDRITHLQSTSHVVEMHYQWRAISMDLRYQNIHEVDGRSSLLLIFSRQF